MEEKYTLQFQLEEGKTLDEDRLYTKQKITNENNKTVDKKTVVTLNKDGTFEITDLRKECNPKNIVDQQIHIHGRIIVLRGTYSYTERTVTYEKTFGKGNVVTEQQMSTHFKCNY